jgi:hypothetical protein
MPEEPSLSQTALWMASEAAVNRYPIKKSALEVSNRRSACIRGYGPGSPSRIRAPPKSPPEARRFVETTGNFLGECSSRKARVSERMLAGAEPGGSAVLLAGSARGARRPSGAADSPTVDPVLEAADLASAVVGFPTALLLLLLDAFVSAFVPP